MGEINEHQSRRFADEARADVSHGVERWPGAVALLVAAVLLTSLPADLTVGPRWLPLAVAGVVVAGVVVARRTMPRAVVHWVGLTIPAVASAGVAVSVLLQIASGSRALVTHDLLLSAGLTWGANVLAFALWYWEIDGGGPSLRRKDAHTSADISFPQMALPPTQPPWFPTFLDYLFFSFNTSTAFSPTDSTAFSHRAKLLMMAESLVSLAIIAILLARANTGR